MFGFGTCLNSGLRCTSAERAVIFLVSVLLSTSAAAQSPASTATPASTENRLPDQPLLGSVLTADLIRELPLGNGNPFAVLETIQHETETDLFFAAGLNPATTSPLGSFLNSWTQSVITLGDIPITDPRTGGVPMLLPYLPLWERMTTSLGAMGVDDPASSLSLRLDPTRPGATWTRMVEGSLGGRPLPSSVPTVPAADLVNVGGSSNVLVSGPLSPRLGLVAGGSWQQLSHLPGASLTTTTDDVTSGFGHLVFAVNPRDEFRVLGWGQRAATSARTDVGLHVQSTWEHRDPGHLAWRVFGGYTQRERSGPNPATVVVDSLLTPPVSDLLDPDTGTTRRWTLGARLSAPGARWLPAVGVDVNGSQARIPPTALTLIGETLDDVQSRLWTVQQGRTTDVRNVTTIAAFVNERLTYGPVSLDAGVRFETTSGSANDSTQNIQWHTWLPRGQVRWDVTRITKLALVAGYRRTAYQLPLNLLAIGDPAAPVADVAIWNTNGTAGPLIARVGPGTGGDSTLTRIDPRLEQPITDELVLAVESRPLPGVHVVLARVTKREDSLLGLVNTGVASSSYSAFQVEDVSFLPGSDDGAPFATVYNRPANQYGADRYLLTNRTVEAAKFWGIDLSVRVDAKRLTILAGGTLTEANGPAAAPGFLPTENDQDLLGNLLVDPNDLTHARGQLFQDRSHNVKIAGIYRFPWDVHFGAIARYQDGQPFSRLIVVPNLVQGRTAVRGYPNGGTAFTYIGTLDMRLQKIFTRGQTKVAMAVDVYNVPGLDNEAAEYVVSGTRFRDPSTLQPPRTAVASVRLTF